jgi:hypothetical protein
MSKIVRILGIAGSLRRESYAPPFGGGASVPIKRMQRYLKIGTDGVVRAALCRRHHPGRAEIVGSVASLFDAATPIFERRGERVCHAYCRFDRYSPLA